MNDIKAIIENHFPDLNIQGLLDELLIKAKIISVKEGDIIMDYAEVIAFIPLLFEGKLKIFKEDDKGNELFLYYIHPGQGCAVSFACFDKMSSVRAQAVEPSKLLSIPNEFMEKWMLQYPEWNRFVLRIFNQRFDEVLETLNEVAFHKLDERLLDYLEKQSFAFETQELSITHQQIAQELNSSREVISRLLKKMEQQGLIEMSRNKILLK